MMANLAGKTVLVIGASGSFGQELSKQLMTQGAKVIGTSSSAASSSRLPIDLAQRLLVDLTDRTSIQTLSQYLLASKTPIDAIVLAAGLVAFGTIHETPAEVVSKLMSVNSLGQIDIVSQLVPALTESAAQNREPFILSISGVISEPPMAGLAAYSASKTAIHGYAKAATKELKKLGIRWLDARPGHTESGLATRAIYGTAPNFGVGESVENVVSRIIAGILNDEPDLPSTSFK